MAVQTISLESQVGPDGVLDLHVPIGMPNSTVVVIVVPITSAKKSPEDLGWSPGFLEETAGSIPDFPDIESEGDYEIREEPSAP
jgi:hypothetical protein